MESLSSSESLIDWGKVIKKATINNKSTETMAAIQVLTYSKFRLLMRVFLSIFMLHSTASHYNQMYNMPEFNLINKEDAMSQGSKGSTKLMIAIWAIIMLFIGFKAYNTSSHDPANENTQVDSATLERIKPIGEVSIDSSSVVASTGTSNQTERSGEQVYSKCQSCHDSGILEAPKFGTLEDWAPRIERGIDDLLMVAIAGKGGMPPKGACMDCSDNELRSAIQYMIDSAK